MIHIVEWLIRIEDWASRIYAEAAQALKADAPVYELLKKLAEDEAMHFHFMQRVLFWLKQHPDGDTDIRLDNGTVENVERPLKEIETSVRSGSVDGALVIRGVFEAEHSEWNHLFLYVMNAMKHRYPDFLTAGPSIQHHIRSIERFLEKYPGKSVFPGTLKPLSPVWEEKILIVDDSELILSLMRSVLSKVGIVHTAQNGEEAFLKASENYYAVIISDIDMPMMNGIALYSKLHSRFPHIQKRFILMSGAPDSSALSFMKNEKLTFLHKPFTIREVRNAVFSVMDQLMG